MKNSSVNWEGIFPAVTTKFTANDDLDLTLFEKSLDTQVKAGVNGLVIGGSLGEASTITNSEKELMIRFSVEKTSGRIPVIMNIAAGSTKEAISHAILAEKWGAAGLMLLPPMRYYPDQRETITFFKSVASHTSLPIMIYNNPVDYKVEVTIKMFEELEEFENIQAVKESTRDVTNITRMINRFGKRFKLLCGVDTLVLEELCMGADGWVAGLVNAFPFETVRLYELFRSGRVEEARKLYQWFIPLLELDIHPKLVQYIKLAETVTGLGSEYVRAPRLTLMGEERERILKVINDAIRNRPTI